MSTNQYSSDLPESLCFSSPKTCSSFISTHLIPNSAGPVFNEYEEELMEEQSTSRQFEQLEVELITKEHLFEKPLTPSDVGKLNRLVIPKQNAEKYFPLNGAVDTGEKGLLLTFEDELGKSWRFRYSYWNSSQSYVLTKGWSRFVKEKRLDAGDIVLFARHKVDVRRLFIGWRRRYSGGPRAPPRPGNQESSSLPYQPPACPHADNQTTATTGKNNSKRLIRLFGVNLEWQSSEPEGSSMSSQGRTHQQPYHSNHHTHTDMN